MNIEISLKTGRRLKKIMTQDETFELVIRRLLDKFENTKSSPLPEPPRQRPPSDKGKNKIRRYGADDIVPATFTKITSATINGKVSKNLYWNPLIKSLLVILSKKGINIKSGIHTKLNIGHVKKQDQGYNPSYELDLSIQDVSANIAARVIQDLALRYDISVDIDFFWRVGEDSAFPGDSGRISIN